MNYDLIQNCQGFFKKTKNSGINRSEAGFLKEID